MHEAQTQPANCFITLTYNDASIPDNNSLDTKEWQKFAKAARKKLKTELTGLPNTFRYYHCGEYGPLLGRPHYHACIFGQDFDFDRKKWRPSKTGHPQWRSQTLENLWGKGFAVVSEMNFDCAAYVARYAMKKVTGNMAEHHYWRINTRTMELEQTKPEYSTMSRKPGLGKKWYDKYGTEAYEHDSVIVNGREAKPPKYYDDQYEITNEEEMENIKNNRITNAKKRIGNSTRKQLDIRERVQLAKLDLFRRQG